LKSRSDVLTKAAEQLGATAEPPRAEGELDLGEPVKVPDIFVAVEQRAIQFLKENAELQNQIRNEGVRWGIIQSKMANALKDVYQDAFNKIHELGLVKTALDGVFGASGWHSAKDANGKSIVRTK
jgi:hypothetical protein